LAIQARRGNRPGTQPSRAVYSRPARKDERPTQPFRFCVPFRSAGLPVGRRPGKMPAVSADRAQTVAILTRRHRRFRTMAAADAGAAAPRTDSEYPDYDADLSEFEVHASLWLCGSGAPHRRAMLPSHPCPHAPTVRRQAGRLYDGLPGSRRPSARRGRRRRPRPQVPAHAREFAHRAPAPLQLRRTAAPAPPRFLRQVSVSSDRSLRRRRSASGSGPASRSSSAT